MPQFTHTITPAEPTQPTLCPECGQPRVRLHVEMPQIAWGDGVEIPAGGIWSLECANGHRWTPEIPDTA